MMGWEELERTCLSCTGCGLCEKRHHVVFGTGNREADRARIFWSRPSMS